MFYEVKNCTDNPNKGKGIFASKFIPKGTVIWKGNLAESNKKSGDYNCLCWEKDEFLEKLSSWLMCDQMSYITHAFVHPKTKSIIYILDDNKYTNHSDCPNVFTSEDLEVIALCDIEEGIEITENYNSLNDEWYRDLEQKYGMSIDYYT